MFTPTTPVLLKCYKVLNGPHYPDTGTAEGYNAIQNHKSPDIKTVNFLQ